MKNSIWILSCILLSATICIADNVPVLLFGKSLPFKVPALNSLHSEEFSNLIQSQVEVDTVTVVFIEPKLNIEDLTRCKTSEGVTCFKQLSSIAEKSYLPNVNNAIDSLYDNLESAKTTIDIAEDVFSAIEAGNRVVFVNLDLALEKDDYVKHDKLIGDVFSKLSQKYKNIVAIYTGRTSELNDMRLIRKPRATNGTNKKDVSCKHFRIIAEKIFIKTSTSTEGEPETKDLESCSSSLEDQKLTVTIVPSDLKMIFRRAAGTWYLAEGTIGTENVNVPGYLYANEGFTYRCGGNLTFYNADQFVKIHNLQFTPDFESETVTSLDPNKIVYCEGFWTPGILTGLFVVFILLIILMIGLSWIMDIKTYDRFDDPKGKTITINATD